MAVPGSKCRWYERQHMAIASDKTQTLGTNVARVQREAVVREEGEEAPFLELWASFATRVERENTGVVL